MKYTCTHGFCVPKYDEDGRLADYSDVEPGDVYELVDMCRRFVGGPNSVRLKGAKNWLEIGHDRFRECFVPAEEVSE